MPIRVVTGPPFAGKSQAVAAVRRPGDVLLDTTEMWRAMYSPAAGDERTDEQARVVNQAKRAALDRAVELEQDGWLTTSERDPARLQRLLTAAGAQKALLVTAAMSTLRERARRSGPTCEALVDKWDGYADDEGLAAITEPWNEDDMRTIIDVETEYRAACEALVRRDDPQGAVCRCLTEDADLRADMDAREVSGILVRYGDEARIPGFRERIAPGAFTLRDDAQNVTMQHNRELPIGRADGSYIDDQDAMRFRFKVSDTARGGQMLEEVKAGLWRGASVEMRPTKDRMVRDGNEPPLIEVVNAVMLRYSIVDVGAYPDSRIRLRKRDPETSILRSTVECRVVAYLLSQGGASMRQCRTSVVGSSASIDAALRKVGVKGEDGLWRMRPEVAPAARVPRRDYRRMMVS